MFSMLQDAGWPVWFLLIASILALAAIIERIYFLRPSRILPPLLFQQVLAECKQRSVDVHFIEELYNHSYLGRIFSCVLRSKGMSRAHVKDLIEEEAEMIVCELERFLTLLGTIAAIAPLLGLFGTVIGMIHIFGAGHSGLGTDPLEMAHGIGIALYNTAFGLIVAVPSLIFYRYFRSLVMRLLTDMITQGLRLLDINYSRTLDPHLSVHLNSSDLSVTPPKNSFSS